MSEWPYTIQSSSPDKYQFKLVSDTDSIICSPEPLEWKSGTIEMKRDLESGGVFSSFLVDSLTFVGNGANFLKALFAAKGVNAKCTLIIYYWKGFDTVPANGRQYVEYPTRFDVNFNFYEIVKVGRFYFGVRVKVINSSTQTKLDNRQDIDVDITKTKTIGGVTVTDYTDLKKELFFSATDVRFRARLNDLTTQYNILRDRTYDTYTSIPVKIDSTTGNDFEEIRETSYLTKLFGINYVPSFFAPAIRDYTLDIDYTFKFIAQLTNLGNRFTVKILRVKRTDGILEEFIIGEIGDAITTMTGSVQIPIFTGNELLLAIKVLGGSNNYNVWGLSSDMNISVVVSTTPATTTEGFPIYEALERVCQHDLDIQYPIYSDFFARAGIAYTDGLSYSSGNQLRYSHVLGGLNLRGAKLDNEDAPLVLNFKNLFKSLKAIYNIGYSLEYLFNETVQRVRIEEYSHFFEDVESLDLSDRITKYDIQSQVMPELIPIDLKSGFDNFEYLSLNGRGEPNTTNQRTSAMNTATKLDNISPYRADTKGIYDNIANPLGSQGSTDTKGDNAIFIVKSQIATQGSAYDWIPEKAENIQIVSGSLFKEDLLNRYFTPTRMLRRHGNRISAGMQLFTDTSLRFQKSDKSSLLETTGEGYTTVENADILVSDLAQPIYKAMKHTILVSFTFADLEVLKLYPYRYLTFSNDISGYLLNFKKKNNEDKAEITIIERNVILS